jgi:hypothetical protein
MFLFFFSSEVQPTLCKGSAKFRLSERNMKIFIFPSGRNLFKPREEQKELNVFILFFFQGAAYLM